jgi:hypothetical protein
LFSITFTSGKISISINIIAAIKFGISIAVAENLTEKKSQSPLPIRQMIFYCKMA